MCAFVAAPLRTRDRQAHICSATHAFPPPMRLRKTILLTILVLFLLPLAIHAVLYNFEKHPGSFRVANWGSTGMLPSPSTEHEARLLVFTGRTGRWKGIFAVHSWV